MIPSCSSQEVYTNEDTKNSHPQEKELFQLLDKLDKVLLQTDSKSQEIVVLLGDTKEGKSTLMHVIAGRKLVAQKFSPLNDLRIVTLQELEGVIIGNTSNCETTLPNKWEDPENNIIYWDCPGIGGIGDFRPDQDLFNAFYITNLLATSKSCKLILVVSQTNFMNKAGAVLKLLKMLEELFGGLETIRHGLALVVTQGTAEADDFKSYLRTDWIKDQERNMTPHQKIFFEELASKEGRVAAFEKPAQPGPIALKDPKFIENIIKSTNYQILPNSLTPPISDESKLKILCLVNQLNQRIIRLFKEINDQIGASCRKQINNSEDTVARMKTNLRSWHSKIELLCQSDSSNVRKNFDVICEIFSIDAVIKKEMERCVTYLDLCKRIYSKTQYEVDSWFKRLEEFKNELDDLACAPRVTTTREILQLTGKLVGASEVMRVLQGQDINFTQMQIQVKCEIFVIDEDIIAPGVTLSITAVSWIVIGQKSIDISGVTGAGHMERYASSTIEQNENGNGRNGTDGLPGNPGGNGGNFYGAGGKAINIERLTIRTSGGRGGQGQNGGNGANGANGSDGSKFDVEYRKISCRIGQPIPYGFWKKEGFYRKFSHCVKACLTVNGQYLERYESPGGPGGVGGDSGKGGHGGIGGNPGQIILEGFTSEIPAKENQPGENGDDGIPGNPGIGGKFGCSYEALWVEEKFLPIVREVTTIEDNVTDGAWKLVGAGAALLKGAEAATLGVMFGAISVGSSIYGSYWEKPPGVKNNQPRYSCSGRTPLELNRNGIRNPAALRAMFA